MLSKTFIPILNQNPIVKKTIACLLMPGKIDFHTFLKNVSSTFTTVFNRWENIARSTELIAGGLET